MRALSLSLLSSGLLPALILGATAATAQDISLRLPLACEVGKTCFVQHLVDRDPSPATRDYQCGRLTYDGHDGTDLRLPTMAAQKQGVDVLAAADGKVLRTRDGVADVSIAATGKDAVQNIECGNGVVIDHGNGWQTQYCHMAKDSIAVRSGDAVKAGDRLGRVGLSGQTEFPHLHFTVRKDDKAVDPFAFGAAPEACGGGTSLWDASARASLSYQQPYLLNKGFAPGPVTMEAIESGTVETSLPDAASTALVAYIRAVGLRGGDIQTLTLFGPDGKPLAQNKVPALDRDKAQWMSFGGLRRPASGWPPGLYRAVYRVERDGKPVLEQAFGINLKP
ncbi:M23 family metallopeptidase [Microvirga pudoricolor]|uniref:M23 family metallopeptidase n=1 Tax=Microvirga pudoricolor TaxID=2778729 RepID=UPI0019502D14|nr:M23 family metallopeptidase [Microvirga pudoricolor]MBM6593942.1 M23 family metallopeptidase [Microvirga pudoricolor]